MRTSRISRQWALLIVGPALSLVSFVVAYYLNPLQFGKHEPLAAIPAFLLAIVILIISHDLASSRDLEQASAYSDRIYEAVKDYLHVTKVGSPEVGLHYVIDRLPILQEVRNTSFNISDEVERAGEKFYETDVYLHSSHEIAEWTSRKLRWKDIGDTRAVERLRATSASASRLAGRGRSRYQYKLIEHDEPQISFILLGYPDGTREVLFNWDFREIGQDPVVLLSRDRDIVEMFSVQFEQLWRYASPDHDRTAVRSISKK
jgi:hypothetical protein